MASTDRSLMVDLDPLRRVEGYLPIRDHGLIGDGSTAALVGRDGAVSWLCLPRFDSPPVFASVLDRRRGGHLTVAPDEVLEATQRYEDDTGVLITDLRGPDGIVRVTDALVLRPGADLGVNEAAGVGALARRAVVLDGRVRLRVAVEPRGTASVRPDGDGLRIGLRDRSDLALHVAASRPLDGAASTFDLEAGDEVAVVLSWGAAAERPDARRLDEALARTVEGWRRWMGCFRYSGPQEPAVRRSAITLKLLDHVPGGGLVAAPTSSLPESIGGPRNWDYRYTWIRDAAFSVYAMRRIGMVGEAHAFLGWVLDAIGRSEIPRVLYDLDGNEPPPERIDEALEGYRGSQPVRWGNAAADQLQHDVHGEILDCAWQWETGGERLDERSWSVMANLVSLAGDLWRTPDHGIWEVRSEGRVFTYSAAMCQVALDRGARLARRVPGRSADATGWAARAEEVRRAIIDEAWDDEVGAFTEHLGSSGGLDASILALPLRRVVPADHPRMVATVDAVTRRLGAGDGLLYRYLPDESPDGLEGSEGAFVLCSFWLVDNLAKQGRIDEAGALFESLCGRASPLGLLPEQIDPSTGDFLGNHPQAFSHVGLISSGINLARLAGSGR
jgi:alpha,alpha-trehalase